MILDTLSNADKYLCVHPLFAEVFEHIKNINFESIEEGGYKLQEDNIMVIITNQRGRTVEEAISKFECHNRYIDIQLCVSGQEQIGWKPREKCIRQKSGYNEDRDVTFFEDTPDTFLKLTNSQFAVFFPNDVHAPMIGDGIIKKMIFKIKH